MNSLRKLEGDKPDFLSYNLQKEHSSADTLIVTSETNFKLVISRT